MASIVNFVRAPQGPAESQIHSGCGLERGEHRQVYVKIETSSLFTPGKRRRRGNNCNFIISTASLHVSIGKDPRSSLFALSAVHTRGILMPFREICVCAKCRHCDSIAGTGLRAEVPAPACFKKEKMIYLEGGDLLAKCRHVIQYFNVGTIS